MVPDKFISITDYIIMARRKDDPRKTDVRGMHRISWKSIFQLPTKKPALFLTPTSGAWGPLAISSEIFKLHRDV